MLLHKFKQAKCIDLYSSIKSYIADKYGNN